MYACKRQKTEMAKTLPTVVEIKAKAEPELMVKPKDDRSTFDAALAAIRTMNQKAVVTEQIKFAGQTFTNSRAKTNDDIRKE